MQNKALHALKTGLVLFVSAGLLGGWIVISNDIISLSLLPGLLMGFLFVRMHSDLPEFQRKWKSIVLFFIAYSVALFIPLKGLGAQLVQGTGSNDMEISEWIVLSLKGLTGTGVLVLLVKRWLGIRISVGWIFILLLAGTVCSCLFFKQLTGVYGVPLGFAGWQGIVGGLLSYAVLQKSGTRAS